MNFTHLHVHSHYSMLDGMSKVPEIVDKCLLTGMNAVALTDHGNMYGIKDLLDYCKKVNGKNKEKAEAEGKEFVPFKPIVGVEAYCARRSRKQHEASLKAVNGEGKSYTVDASGWHLILLAKNKKGYQNLCKIVSESFMEDSYYHKPRIDKELLAQYHEGLICSSACLGGELPQNVMLGLAKNTTDETTRFAEAEETVKWFKNVFGEDYYIELQRHQTTKPGGAQDTYQKQKMVNPVLLDLAKKYDVKVIATNDSHFVNEDDAEAHDHLICIATGQLVSDEKRLHYTKQEWLKTPEEMEQIFSDVPEALTNTQEIVDKVEVYDINSAPIMPNFPIPEDFGTEEEYHKKFTEQELFDEFTRNEHGEVVMSQEDAEAKVKKLGGYEKLYRIKLEADYLAMLTYKGAKERYGDPLTPEQSERINFELHTMKTMGFPGYFLIVMDFIRAAREELDVLVGPGRGSAAGSVVAYCLHITDLDPLKYDLLFERFLNPDRVSLPDIDTDFDDAGRKRVLEWVGQKYGRTHVAHIITYGTMAAKSAIQDVGRAEGMPLSRVAELKAMIPDSFPDSIKDEKGKTPKVTLKNCLKYVEPMRQIMNGDDPQAAAVLKYAAQLENTVRNTGVHACGFIIGADELTKFAPLSTVEDTSDDKDAKKEKKPKKDKNEKDRVLVTEYDGHVIESVGLIKMDFLGLKTLSIIRECQNNIKKARNMDIDIAHIPIDDPDTYKLFQEGRTVAVFQFESAGMRKYMKELQPTVIGDLIAMNALYRPGPMDYIPQFIRRKKGQEEVTYDIPIMEKYLKDTYGVTVYQEQVMLLSRLLANFTRGQSDTLRKAMGKKQMDTLQSLKGKFLEGGKANGHDEQKLNKIWQDWEKFASYAFNKSHAACYSWVAYQTAYLKAHFPAEFMAANLTIAKDDIKEVSKLMDECKAMKIQVLEPDVNESDLNFMANANGNIRFGLGGVKGIGEGAAEAVIRERTKNGPFKDIFDFVERVDLSACNKKTIESMVLAGAFDCFDQMYREQFFGINAKGETTLDVLVRYGNKFQQDKQQQQNSLFGDLSSGLGVEMKRPEIPQTPRWSTTERLNKEKEHIGIYLSAHPLDDWQFEVNEVCDVTAAQLTEFEGWRTPDARAAAEQKMAEEAAQQDEQDDEEPDNEEEKEKPLTPIQWIKTNEGRMLMLGGIVVSAEERISQKGNPYGQYVVEDYSGSYRFALFGNAYQQFNSLLKPNVYVSISGMVQQKGKGQRYFKPQPEEKADYEFLVQKVMLLKDVQSFVRKVSVRIPISKIDEEMTNALVLQCQEHPGDTPIKLQVYDVTTGYNVSFTPLHAHIDSLFYRWLKTQQADNLLSFSVE